MQLGYVIGPRKAVMKIDNLDLGLMSTTPVDPVKHESDAKTGQYDVRDWRNVFFLRKTICSVDSRSMGYCGVVARCVQTSSQGKVHL